MSSSAVRTSIYGSSPSPAGQSRWPQTSRPQQNNDPSSWTSDEWQIGMVGVAAFGPTGPWFDVTRPTGTATLHAAPALTAAIKSPAVVMTSAPLTNVLFLQESGDATAISVSDINQGQIGDCYVLASIGELALFHPTFISNMIHDNGDGTYTVALWTATNGSLPTFGTTAFAAASVTVDSNFLSIGVNNGATQGVGGGQKEVWVQVLEKAVAVLGGGYQSIAYGGNPCIALEELTGCTATWLSPRSVTLTQVQSYIAAGYELVFDTASTSNLPYNLVSSHAYMFQSLSTINGVTYVNLLNPWGMNQPAAIPFSALATSGAIVEIDVGHEVSDPNYIAGTSGNDAIRLTAAITYASVDLFSGADQLTLADGINSAVVANVETLIGGSGSDAITLITATIGASIDLGGGTDSLHLANGGNLATIGNVESVVGGSGGDTIVLSTALQPGVIDLGDGADKLTLAYQGGNNGVVSNVETLVGSAGNDAIGLGTAILRGSVDLGAGSDRLTLASASNVVSVANVETISGADGSDTVILASAAVRASIDLGAGADAVLFGNFSNTASVAGAETINGGSGADTITLMAALTAGMAVDLGTGADKLILAAAGNTGTIRNVESLNAAAGDDAITLATAVVGGSVDLGDGNDALVLADGSNTVQVSNVETLIGGGGSDTVTLRTRLTGDMNIDLGAGADKLTLTATGNAGLLHGVETLVGGAGADQITLQAVTGKASVDLGAGADRLTLGDDINTVSSTNVETIVGGSGTDMLTLTTGVTNGSIDLGAGDDTIRLSHQASRLSVGNVESIVGGAAADTIILTGGVGATMIGGAGLNFMFGGSGADTFVFDQATTGNYTTVRNFGAGDRIGLDVAGVTTLNTDTYDLGGAGLVDGGTIMKVANATARLGAVLNNGHGAFVYEQASGGLYYSATGNFSGGGTEVGIVTTSGTTPWVYDASRFVAM